MSEVSQLVEVAARFIQLHSPHSPSPYLQGHLGPAGRSVRSHEDIDDEPQEVNTSYEFFKGKEFGDEPSQGETRRGDYGPGKKTDYSRMDSTAPGSGSGKFSTFETPVQRLTRLQGEVEEMQEVVQVFLNSHATGEGDKAHRNVGSDGCHLPHPNAPQ
eukprot:GHVN01006230.1.p2 GENE.GHVN01006230.1~~GHVN01006230.1.p2  ORF type:complete len:158 (-),score=43.51 GHVN01006230.1:1008-1481(-)